MTLLEPMKLGHNLSNRRREMEVLFIFLHFLLPMGVVGVTKIEALERWEESTDDLQDDEKMRKKGRPSSGQSSFL
jgi:hypothetical protein